MLSPSQESSMVWKLLPELPSSPLTLARPLEDLGCVTYPAGISSPNPELNAGAKEGKFRYDRDFLLQFMLVCKEKPDSLPPLKALGLEPADQLSLTRASIGGGAPAGTNLRSQHHSMGQFTTSSKFGPGAERFETGGGRSVSLGGAPVPFRNPPMQRIPSGPGGSRPSHRTRSKRGEKRTDPTKVGPTGPQAHGPVYGQQHAGFSPPAFEHVAPLQMSENRWDRKALVSNDPDAPEVVDRKVKGLLNKLTMEKFDSISDQLIQLANRSENQKDGRTLIQVIRLVFEKATDEATWSEMYARLCRKMMEQISTKVHDEGAKNAKGKPIAGGQLFRKYLLNKCQEDFERGWVAKGASAIKDANERNGSDEFVLYSEEYYVAQKARRQGLGLIKFIGELFKLQMLTERIMHECIKKLLSNAHNPEEEEIESLCTLMTTVGLLLDTQRARVHMDLYFQRMKELAQNLNVSPGMQFMLQDVLELRERKWVAPNTTAGPTVVARIHEVAAKEKAVQETQRVRMSRGGTRRGGNQEHYPQADGCTNKAARKKVKRGSISRTNSSSNMFSMLEASQENKALEQPQTRKLTLQPRTKPLEEPTHPEESVTPSEEDASALGEINEEAADAKIKEDVKEFFNVRNLDEAEVYFTTLPPQHHQSLVNQLTSSAVESKEPDAKLVADLFTRAKNKGLCSPDAFEEGLTPTAEIIEDIAIDAPKAWTLFAIIGQRCRVG
ncbi:ARM repeat-containing protein [Amanita rubescens]|nr:ARM repeat-containing protein [Amanita rubescens]